MSARGSSEAGFSLVEALVSLFVFSLIASGCVLMLMQSVDSQRRVGEAHDSLRELETARALLSADLAQIVGRDVRVEGGQRLPRFIGGDGAVALAFVRASAEPDPERGALTTLARIEYRIEDGRLLRLSRTELDDPAATPSTRVVLSDVRDARFQFYNGAQWRDQWVAQPGGAWPRAVALVVETPRYGEVRIETLVGLGA